MTDTNAAESSGAPPDQTDPFRSAASHLKQSIDKRIPILVDTAVKNPNVEQGRRELIETVTAHFVGTFGSLWATNAHRKRFLPEELKRVEYERDMVFEELLDTPDTLPTSAANQGAGDDGMIDTPFWKWAMPHQFEALFFGSLIMVAAGASMLTAHANLAGTGLIVFIENPLLPWSMSALAVLSAMAIKTMVSQVENETSRKAFAFWLNALAVLFIILWIWLFADQFHGLSTGPITGGLFDEPSWWDGAKETAFVAVTLATEILIAAVLAQRLGKIVTRYTPDRKIPSPKHQTLSERLDALDLKHRELNEEIGVVDGVLTSLQGSLNGDIHIATTSYDAKRAVEAEPIL